MEKPFIQFMFTHRTVAALRLFAILAVSLVASEHLAGQTSDPQPITVNDGLSAGGAVLIWGVPEIAGWHTGPSSCAPCDPGGLPFFDRWAIHEPKAVFARGSDAALIGVALASWIDLAGEGRRGQAALVASVQSLLWAEAVSHLAKGAIGRKRPVLYTATAPDVADVRKNQRSMPSGHTSSAFALATSYWLSRSHLTNDDKPWLRWALMAGATGVGVFRVAAGKHHPSDVLIGAGVGIASALVVHEIKF